MTCADRRRRETAGLPFGQVRKVGRGLPTTICQNAGKRAACMYNAASSCQASPCVLPAHHPPVGSMRSGRTCSKSACNLTLVCCLVGLDVSTVSTQVLLLRAAPMGPKIQQSELGDAVISILLHAGTTCLAGADWQEVQLVRQQEGEVKIRTCISVWRDVSSLHSRPFQVSVIKHRRETVHAAVRLYGLVRHCRVAARHPLTVRIRALFTDDALFSD